MAGHMIAHSSTEKSNSSVEALESFGLIPSNEQPSDSESHVSLFEQSNAWLNLQLYTDRTVAKRNMLEVQKVNACRSKSGAVDYSVDSIIRLLTYQLQGRCNQRWSLWPVCIGDA